MHQQRVIMVLNALKACSKSRDLEKGKRLHADAIESGDILNSFVANSLIDMYAKCGSLREARMVFDKMMNHTVVSWTSLILGYVENEDSETALQLFAGMKYSGCAPDSRTFMAALKACASLAAGKEALKADCLQKGTAIHFEAVQRGCEKDIFLASTLIDMYGKCGELVKSRQVFDSIPFWSVAACTALMLGYTENGEAESALKLFEKMQLKACEPDARAFVAALKACATLASKEEGKEVDGKTLKEKYLQEGKAIHFQAANCGFVSNIYVTSTLIDMYAKCGNMIEARETFDKMSRHGVVSWNALLLGYVDSGEGEQALQQFARMKSEQCSSDSVTFIALLKACGSVGGLEIGKKIHAEICKYRLNKDAVVANCLIDFYGKCGSMADAQQVFDSMDTRNHMHWSALLAGYSRQGDTKRVFDILNEMKKQRLQADGITLLSVLTACSHAGLVDKGKEYFEAMSLDYGVIPKLEHYRCIIDMLGRANQLEEALTVANTMPFKADKMTWMTMLGSCTKWKNVSVGKLAFQSLLKLDETEAAAYVLMGNIYGSVGMWDEKSKIHAMRMNVGVRKKPGESWWTDHAGKVHKFLSGDRNHPLNDDIRAKLKQIAIRMKDAGYVADTGCILHNISDDEKENILCVHSEKLAIAYALLNTPPGSTVRIIKNLRICDDCHRAAAIISQIEKRYIVCRDASRFHIFKNGECSCGDFW